MRKYLVEEGSRALTFWSGKEIGWARILADPDLIHEKNPVGRLAREPHFVRHAHHRTSFPGKGSHHIEYLFDHLGIERHCRHGTGVRKHGEKGEGVDVRVSLWLSRFLHNKKKQRNTS